MSFENNVVALISSTVSADDVSITFNTPVTPFNLPAASGGTLTLSDNLNNPAALEVITYAGLTDNLNGTHTATGVTRAQESTTAAPWAVNHVIYQAVTQLSTNKWDDAADRYLVREDGTQALVDGATINWDRALGNVATVTLAGSRTIAAPTNLIVGSMIMVVTQDATGSRSLTWDAAFEWSGGATPVLSTAANAKDVVSFVCDGATVYGSLALRGAS